jgi:hypothetical protein
LKIKIIYFVAIILMAIGKCYAQTNVKPDGTDCGEVPLDCNKEYPFLICKPNGSEELK